MKSQRRCHAEIASLVSLLVVIPALAIRPTSALAAQRPAELQNVGFDQRLNQQLPLDLPFVDETGEPVLLRDYFTGKPVILVLAYFRCPMLCTLVLNGLVDSLREIPLTIGRDFDVLTVSFDPRETPPLAAAKRENYLKRYGRPGAGGGWHFLTGKQEAIDRLTRAVGFRYVYDAQQDQFIHASGIIILTPSGKLSRYFYGIQYPPLDLRLGLVEASAGKIGSPADQVLLHCFHYDPATGKYTASILNYARALGVLAILAVVAFVWFLWRAHRRLSRRLAEETGLATPGTATAPRQPSEDPQGGQR